METAADVCGGAFNTNSAVGIAYGFNNPNFSDRLLKILVAPDPSESGVGELIQTSDAEESSSCRVTTVHINSLLLASHSPFFYKMFSNGMKESEQRTVTLSVLASEESPLLDLLQFMYEGKLLKSTTEVDLLRVLILADRYQVVSCVTYCAQTLSMMPMSFELAVSCISLPSSVLETDNPHLHSLVNAATCFLSKNFTLHRDSALKLSLESIQSILSWNTLEVDSEDDVYDFVLEWARTHYKDLSERRRAFNLQLCELIRLRYMSYEKVTSILQSDELERLDAIKVVFDVLLSKFENHPTSQGLGRAYRLQPVVVPLRHNPYQECIVYSELKKEKCAAVIGNSGPIYSQKFHIGGESFILVFSRQQQESPLPDCFAIALRRMSSNIKKASLMMTVRTAVKLKSTCEYMTEFTSKNPYSMGNGRWCKIGKCWDSFMAGDSEYFIDGVLYTRLSITLHP